MGDELHRFVPVRVLLQALMKRTNSSGFLQSLGPEARRILPLTLFTQAPAAVCAAADVAKLISSPTTTAKISDYVYFVM